MTNIKTEDLKETFDVRGTAADSENTEDLNALAEAVDSESVDELACLDGAVDTDVVVDLEEMTTDIVVSEDMDNSAAEGIPAAVADTTDAAESMPLEDAEIAVLNDTAEAGPDPEETPEEEAQELAALDSADTDEPGTDAVDGDIEDTDINVAEPDKGHCIPGTDSEKDNFSGNVSDAVSDEAGSEEKEGAGASAAEHAENAAPAAENTPEPKMALLVSVGFRNAGKKLYYRTGGYDLHIGDRVIVETVRGMEMGSVVMPPMQMDLRKLHIDPAAIVRPANAVDLDQEAENRAREREAYHVCKQKIGEHGLEMKLVQAEYTFDRNKLIFYFTADGRVDFRQLLKDLASTFHTRIELRQIGVRDETRVLGGIGVCGREVCCKTYLRTFAPVSVKMAKEQNLSLNPTKISGLCGRLMCCLKNEEETYEYLNRAMPRLGSRVQTKEGETGVVKNIDILKQKASVLFEENDEREMRVYNVSDLVFRSYRGKREEGMEIPPANVGEEGIRPADGDVEIDISPESELGASGTEEGSRSGRRGDRSDRRSRRNDRSDCGDRDDRRGGNRSRGNYRGNREDRRDAGSEGGQSPDSHENGNHSRRNNDRRNGGYDRGYRRDSAGGNDGEDGQANGGYNRGYRKDSEGGEGEGPTNGGYSRGYRDDFKGDRRRGNGNRNRHNDGRGKYSKDGGGRHDGSDAQGKREDRRPAEEQS